MGDIFGGDVSIPAFQGVDTTQLQQQAQQAAIANAHNSYNLQNQLYPGYGNFANNTYTALSNGLTTNQAAPITAATQSNPLLADAQTVARQQLALGGQLPPDVAEQVARQAAESAGQAGFAGGAPTQNVVSESLGLNSLNLLNNRLGTAASLGTATAGVNAQQQALTNAVNEFNAATVPQINQAGALGAGALLAGIGLPTSGLDPGQIASVSIADVNARNNYNQQTAQIEANQKSSQLGFLGDIFGAASKVGAAALLA